MERAVHRASRDNLLTFPRANLLPQEGHPDLTKSSPRTPQRSPHPPEPDILPPSLRLTPSLLFFSGMCALEMFVLVVVVVVAGRSRRQAGEVQRGKVHPREVRGHPGGPQRRRLVRFEVGVFGVVVVVVVFVWWPRPVRCRFAVRPLRGAGQHHRVGGGQRPVRGRRAVVAVRRRRRLEGVVSASIGRNGRLWSRVSGGDHGCTHTPSATAAP